MGGGCPRTANDGMAMTESFSIQNSLRGSTIPDSRPPPPLRPTTGAMAEFQWSGPGEFSSAAGHSYRGDFRQGSMWGQGMALSVLCGCSGACDGAPPKRAVIQVVQQRHPTRRWFGKLGRVYFVFLSLFPFFFFEECHNENLI